MNRRRALAVLALGAVAPGVLAACRSETGSTSSGQAAEEAPAAAQVSFSPKDAADDVAPTTRVGAKVDNGWFQKIRLTNPDGKAVAGALNRDRTEFTVSEPLGYGVTYRWAG